MLASSGKFCGLIVYRSHGILPIPKHNMVQASSNIGRRTYSKDKDGCCKQVAQTEGKRVEPWPKNDPPPQAWRSECPRDPQPPNYDPYRIKVPDVVVPPLPPCNAKWPEIVLNQGEPGGHHPGYPPGHDPRHHQHGMPLQQPGMGMQEQGQAKEEEEEGFMGMLKSLFGKGKKEDKGPSNTMVLDTRTVDCLKAN